MIEYTKNHQVELSNDLLMIRDKEGQLLKAVIVPVVFAVERFQEMVKRIKEYEKNNK